MCDSNDSDGHFVMVIDGVMVCDGRSGNAGVMVMMVTIVGHVMVVMT